MKSIEEVYEEVKHINDTQCVEITENVDIMFESTKAFFIGEVINWDTHETTERIKVMKTGESDTDLCFLINILMKKAVEQGLIGNVIF